MSLHELLRGSDTDVDCYTDSIADTFTDTLTETDVDAAVVSDLQARQVEGVSTYMRSSECIARRALADTGATLTAFLARLAGVE